MVEGPAGGGPRGGEAAAWGRRGLGDIRCPPAVGAVEAGELFGAVLVCCTGEGAAEGAAAGTAAVCEVERGPSSSTTAAATTMAAAAPIASPRSAGENLRAGA